MKAKEASEKSSLPSQYVDPVIEKKKTIQERLSHFIKDLGASHKQILEKVIQNIPHVENLNTEYLSLALLFYFERPLIESEDIEPSFKAIQLGSHNQLLNSFHIYLSDSASQATFLRYYDMVFDAAEKEIQYNSTDQMVEVIQREEADEDSE